uniref:Uncharacterized protein n=1 Tax=Anguilla anguilla TaxID=7936 RepID=A0A0E9S0L9_ANGAN
MILRSPLTAFIHFRYGLSPNSLVCLTLSFKVRPRTHILPPLRKTTPLTIINCRIILIPNLAVVLRHGQISELWANVWSSLS